MKRILLCEKQDVNTSEKESNWLQRKTSNNSLLFSDPQQVINFLSAGEVLESTELATKPGIQVIVAELSGEAAASPFP